MFDLGGAPASISPLWHMRGFEGQVPPVRVWLYVVGASNPNDLKIEDSLDGLVIENHIESMTEDMTDDELKARIAESEAKTAKLIAESTAANAQMIAGAIGSLEALLAGLRSEVTDVRTELARIPRTSTLIGWITGAAIGVAGVVLTALAFGSDRFDGGVQVGVSVPMAAQIELNKQHGIALANELEKVTDNQSEILTAIKALSPIPEQRQSGPLSDSN